METQPPAPPPADPPPPPTSSSDPPPQSTPSDPPPPPIPTPSPPPPDPPDPLTQPSPPIPPSSSPSPSQSQSQPPQPPPSTFLRPPLSRPRPPPAQPQSAPVQRGGGVAIGVPARGPMPPAPFSSFRPSPPFSQPFPAASSAPSPSFAQSFGGFPRSSSAGGADHSTAASTSQARPGVQTIGMIGSLSAGANSSQMRPGGIPGQQQRLGQIPVRSITTSQNYTSQKLQSHGVSRGPSMTSPNLPSSAPQGTQSLQQSWMPSQGKQSHAPSLPSSSYRPPTKQHVMQQRSQPPQQPQHQVQINSHQQQQQQHQQQHQQQQQQQKHHLQLQQQFQQHLQQQQQQQVSMPQEFLSTPRNQPSLLPQQQAARAHGLASPNQNAPTSVQPAAVQSGAHTPIVTTDAVEYCDEILSKRSIHELITQVDPSEKLDPDVEDVLVEIADDFIESITAAACSLAKHRKSTTLEAKDILLHVERNWNMTLPGFSGDEIKLYKKPCINDIHKERLAMIKKSMAVTNDSGSAKNPSAAAGQAVSNSKTHAAKVSAAATGSMVSPPQREPP